MRGTRNKVTLGTLLIGVLLIAFSFIASIISPMRVSAQGNPAEYKWIDKGTIRATNFDTGGSVDITTDFRDDTPDDANREFLMSTATNACKKPKIVVNADKAGGTVYTYQNIPNGGGAPGGTCAETKNSITLGDVAKASEAGGGATSGSGTEIKEDPDTACSLAVGTSIGGKSVSWVICAFNDAIARAVFWFDNIINTNLQPDLTIFDKTGNGSSYHSAWNSFRVIALGFVVIAALIMVITQAAGLEILDAYTVRKILPRLLFAAIFITISWDVLELFYRLSDAATTGVRSLIFAPFSGLDAVQLGGGSVFSGALLGGGAIVAMGWMALLSFGLSALLAVALAFFILILIKIALAGILIASPIFIAAAILPGTSKLYEFGKGALISLLLAPVVVSAMIALFRVGAVIAYNRADGNPAINQIIAILLYFGAYAALLKGLSAMGGVAATITGAVSDRGKGLFGGLKKYRSDTRKERRGKMASGSLYKGNNPLAMGINRATQTGANIGKGAGLGIMPGSRRKHAALNDLGVRAAGERAMKSEAMQQLQYDDDGIAAMFLSGGKSSRRARSELRRMHSSTDRNGNVTWHNGWNDDRVNRAVSTAESVGINRENAVAAGTLGARNKFRSLAGGQAGIDAIDSTANYMGGGSTQLRNNIRDGVKYHARTSGRSDLAADDMASSWGRTSMGELNGSAPVAMRAHLQHMSGNYRQGNKAAIMASLEQQNLSRAPGQQLSAAQIDRAADEEVAYDRNAVAQQIVQERQRNQQPALNQAQLAAETDQTIAVRNQQAAVQLLEAHNVLAMGTNADSQAVINQELTALGFNTQARSAGTAEDFLARNAGIAGVTGTSLRTQARVYDAQGGDPSQGGRAGVAGGAQAP